MTQHRQTSPAPDTLASWLQDARSRTSRLVADLTDEQLMGPRLPTLNPLLWEMGPVAWFQEKWVGRPGGQTSVHPEADALYNSTAIPHDVRWDLPLPTRAETLAYMQRVQNRVLDRIHQGLDEPDAYFAQLAVFHEDMHAEA